MNPDDIRRDRDKEQQKLRSILNTLDTAGDEEVRRIASELNARNAPTPAYRDPYPGEYPRRHAEFVTARLRLIRAMGRTYEDDDINSANSALAHLLDVE